MKIMIHACPSRMWYVTGFLVPELHRQGLPRSEIILWNDAEGKGNLLACMESFASRNNVPGGTWHLQDDVLPASDFVEYAREFAGDMLVCGFCFSGYEDTSPPAAGIVPMSKKWRSTFPCSYIPNHVASDCARWFFDVARHQSAYAEWLASGKMDDAFFHEYCTKQLADQEVLNLAPHMVEHIDYMIGGTTINGWRGHATRGYYFDDQKAMDRLDGWLKTVRKDVKLSI